MRSCAELVAEVGLQVALGADVLDVSTVPKAQKVSI